MNSRLLTTVLTATLTFTVAATTGCAVDGADESNQEPSVEKTETASEPLMIGAGGSRTGVGWCKCKFDCDTVYTSPVANKACKAQCDADKKCGGLGAIGGAASGITIQ